MSECKANTSRRKGWREPFHKRRCVLPEEEVQLLEEVLLWARLVQHRDNVHEKLVWRRRGGGRVVRR